ncbi:DUF2631 domain-containing protein [Pseudonocardiaceae bacterium YIM PH 21723]|nr:DUF2631 domain-containing protein [Pseudonocardiaceae bacterium YIM PH 21723]
MAHGHEIKHVDPAAEPSVEWGWHGTFPRATRIAGWVCALAMFGMLIGNHRGWVEDAWLIAIGSGMIIALLWDQARSRTPWRR